MAKSRTPEQLVQDSCKHKLDSWMSLGYVIDHLDISALGKRCFRGIWVMDNEIGRNDLVVYLNIKSVFWLYLIECKRKGINKLRDGQIVYFKRFDGVSNVIKELVNDPAQIDETIGNLTGYKPENMFL